MTISQKRQLYLALWKISKRYKRNKGVLVLMYVIPILVVISLLFMRISPAKHKATSTVYHAEGVTTKRSLNETEIVFAPNTGAAKSVMDRVKEMMLRLATQNELSTVKGDNDTETNQSTTPNIRFRGYADESEIVRYFWIFHKPENVFAVVFTNVEGNKLPVNTKYKIRPNSEKVDWMSGYQFPTESTKAPQNESTNALLKEYTQGLFVTLQYYVDLSIIAEQASINTSDIMSQVSNVFLRRVPYPPYTYYRFAHALVIIPSFMVLGYIVVFYQIIKNIVYERECRLTELMKLNGLSTPVYWCSWIVAYLVYSIPLLVVTVIVITIPISGASPFVNGLLLFLVFLLWALAVISFAILVTVFFSRATVASIVGLTIFVMMNGWGGGHILSEYHTLSRASKMAASLLMNIGFMLSMKIVSIHETTGEGAQWSNFMTPPTSRDNTSLSDIMLVMFLDIWIYLIIAWYVHQVVRGKYGIPQPWYFLVTKQYWRSYDTVQNDTVYTHSGDDCFESDPDLKVGISIHNLHKEFAGGVVAVAGMTMNMYEGQITALVGPNGAGKTTTISMLSGLVGPTSGTAIINDHDVMSDTSGAWSSISICPQNEILFDTLTVSEHLKFHAHLKGCPSFDVELQVNGVLRTIGLLEKYHAMVTTLSGGEKRRLSIGIAVCGDAKVILLDEPSSGVDPSGRRELWDVIRKIKPDRTILLSTHFMDEADILADRIAVMVDGVVKCCGSSTFLKDRYGAGYHLTLVKGPHCVESQVTDFIRQYVPDAMLSRSLSADITYTLTESKTLSLRDLFTDLDLEMTNLGIVSFGISETTLDDVFLRIVDKRYDSAGQNEEDISRPLISFHDHLNKASGLNRIPRQYKGLFIKKMIYSMRSKSSTLAILFIPIIFLGLAIAGVRSSSKKPNRTTPVVLNLKYFGQSNVPVGTTNSTNFTTYSNVYEQLFRNTKASVHMGSAEHFTLDYFKEKGTKEDITHFKSHYLLGSEFGRTAENRSYMMGYYSGEANHMRPISLAYLLNAICKVVAGEQFSIETINQPLPKSDDQKETKLNDHELYFITSEIELGMIIVLGIYILLVIKERVVGANHIQISAGVPVWLYWFSNFTFDMVLFMFSCPLLQIVIENCALNPYSGSRYMIIFLVLMLYGSCGISLAYLLSFLFKTATGGMAFIVITLAVGIDTVFYLIQLIFDFFITYEGIDSFGDPDYLEDTSDYTITEFDWYKHVIIQILPTECLKNSLYKIIKNEDVLAMCNEYIGICDVTPNQCCAHTGKCGNDSTGKDIACYRIQGNYFSFYGAGVGIQVCIMILEALVFMTLVLAADMNVWNMLSRRFIAKGVTFQERTGVDDDVKEEENRITADRDNTIAQNILVIKDMYKTFDTFTAVNRISVVVNDGECLGLLGVNGAGKTTTFHILTGDVSMSGGEAFINGYSVNTARRMTRRDMGYCPQTNALIDELTGRETLYMYARLRGVASSEIPRVVRAIEQELLLTEEVANKLTCYYSGGNKRKLCTAIALIGDPRIVFLDEPTTGMDPAARRKLWNVISAVRSSGRTIVFTSHSMEECDAICTRIAIMVNGQFRCLGSPQHLKSKFGSGYTLTVRISSPGPLLRIIADRFPSHRVLSAGHGVVCVTIDETVAHIFAVLEEERQRFPGLEDYSITQPTLDQIFVEFARSQNLGPEKPPVRQNCCDYIREKVAKATADD